MTSQAFVLPCIRHIRRRKRRTSSLGPAPKRTPTPQTSAPVPTEP